MKNVVKQVELTWLSARVALTYHGVSDEVQAEAGWRAEKRGFVTVINWVLEEFKEHVLTDTLKRVMQDYDATVWSMTLTDAVWERVYYGGSFHRVRWLTVAQVVDALVEGRKTGTASWVVPR